MTRRLVVGVIGHVDHGKTALVRALTGIETDRLPEERARGISIALGFAHLDAADGTVIDLIDMPGHERFVRTMIAGATGIDAVLLVVAANEGVKPQTREHLAIAGLLGIDRAVVAVTKCDLVGADEAALVGEEAVALSGESGLSPAYLITSATDDSGIADLRDALLALAATTAPRRADGTTYLPIDRAFAIAGHGPVVTGTLRGAELRAGDTLELWPSRELVRVRAVEMHGAPVTAAAPGQRVAVNLRDVGRGQLARGMALAAPGALAASAWLTVALRATADAPPLRNGQPLRALLGTAEVEARLRLLDAEALEPGAAALAQLRFAKPVAIPPREHVILRIASPARTVAGGRVLEPVARRRRRHDALALARLATLRDRPPEAILAAEIVHADTTIEQLSRLTALAPLRVTALLAGLPVTVTRKGAVLREAELARLAERLPELVGHAPLGLSRGQLAALLPGTRAVALDEALARLAGAGVLVRRGGQFAFPDAGADRARVLSDTERAERIAAMLQAAGLSPPNPAAIVTDADAARAVERLLRAGTLVRAVDRAKRRDMLFHRDAIADARRRLAPQLVEPGLLVTEIGAALGISRKFTMPLVAHLDATGVTRRVGDRRVAGRALAVDTGAPLREPAASD